MKKKILIILLLAALIGLTAVAWSALDSDESATPYRTGKVTRGDIAEVVTANGTLNPLEIVNVGAQVSGQTKQIYVELNQEVKKGQLLAEIDPALPLAQLRQSKSNLETARTSLELSARNLERTRELVKKDYLPKTDLENAEQGHQSSKNAFEQAQYEVEQAELNLGYTKIISPIDGVIIVQEVTKGQTLTSQFQTPNLFKIAGDLTKMKIDVNFSEADIKKVKADMPVTFSVDAFPDEEFEGIVQLVNLNPNNQSGVVTYSVTVSVDNSDRKLLPGMTAFVRVILSERKDVLRIPPAALRFAPPQQQVSGLTRLLQFGIRRPGNNPKQNDTSDQTIYLLKNGAPQAVPVTVGSTDETFVEITGEGIQEGDTVITGMMPKKR